MSKNRVNLVEKFREEEKGAFKIRFRMLPPLGIRERLNQQMPPMKQALRQTSAP
jgi:hypothetical protein